MKTFTVSTGLKAISMFALAGMMMGNSGCPATPAAPEARQLRRRVQMGTIEAPKMTLPSQAGGGTFDFSLALNSQLQKVLKESNTFSTAGGFYDPNTVSGADKDEFNKCTASNPAKAFEISDDTACMINMPLAYVSAQMLDFRFQRGTNVDIGLSDLGSVLSGVDLSFGFDKAQFTMSLQSQNPILGVEPKGHTLAAKNGYSYFTAKNAKLGLDFGFLKFGIGGWLKSDMAKVVQDGLADGVKQLKLDWDNNDLGSGIPNIASGWYAMVIKDCDMGIMISAGNKSDAGLMVDDILAVYNINYDWYGMACNSRIRYMDISTDAPIAYVRVKRVSDTVSNAVIIEDDPVNYPYQDMKIKPGARVYLKKWAPVPPTAQ